MLSKFQLPSYHGVDKGVFPDNYLINDGALCKRALTTPGLLDYRRGAFNLDSKEALVAFLNSPIADSISGMR